MSPNSETDAPTTVDQGKNEPAVTGADETRSVSESVSEDRALATERVPGEFTDEDLDNMTTDEVLALSRAAESRMNVFRSLANGDDRHGPALAKAQADYQRYADVLRDHNYDPTGAMIDPTLTVPDKEGTAPTLADATGTFAADAETANVGGIGINDSNADPEGAKAKLEEQAARDDMTDARGTSALMDRSTTAKARREANSTGRTGKSQERVRLKEKA